MLKHPQEILQSNPDIKKIWNANDIGYLLRLRLVEGKKLIRSCLIEEKDVQKLFKEVKKNSHT